MSGVIEADSATGGIALTDRPEASARRSAVLETPSQSSGPQPRIDESSVLEARSTPGVHATHPRVVHTIDLGRGAIGGVAVSADGRRLLATHYGDDSVSVVDTATGAVSATVFGTTEPFAVAAGGQRGPRRAYVGTATTAVDAIRVVDIDTAEVVAAHPVALAIADLVADRSGRRIYVARSGSRSADLLVLDADRGPVGQVDLWAEPGTTAACVRISSSGRQLYVGLHVPDGDVVRVIGPVGGSQLGVLDTIAVGSTIRSMAVASASRAVFVALRDKTVAVIDTTSNEVGATVDVGQEINDVVVSDRGERAYLVTETGLAVLCTHTHRLIDNIEIPGEPACAVESPDGTHLYVAGYDGAVSAVSVGTYEPSAANNGTIPTLADITTERSGFVSR